MQSGINTGFSGRAQYHFFNLIRKNVVKKVKNQHDLNRRKDFLVTILQYIQTAIILILYDKIIKYNTLKHIFQYL